MTGTEVLMEMAEGFRDHGEAVDLLVVYTDINSNIFVKGNCSLSRALGLAAWAHDHIVVALLRREVEP